MTANHSPLFDATRAHLEANGWRWEPDQDCLDADPRSGHWWTRDEFKGWWRNLKTDAVNDRYVDFAMAVSEQIDMELHGVHVGPRLAGSTDRANLTMWRDSATLTREGRGT